MKNTHKYALLLHCFGVTFSFFSFPPLGCTVFSLPCLTPHIPVERHTSVLLCIYAIVAFVTTMVCGFRPDVTYRVYRKKADKQKEENNRQTTENQLKRKEKSFWMSNGTDVFLCFVNIQGIVWLERDWKRFCPLVISRFTAVPPCFQGSREMWQVIILTHYALYHRSLFTVAAPTQLVLVSSCSRSSLLSLSLLVMPADGSEKMCAIQTHHLLRVCLAALIRDSWCAL